MLPLLQRGDGAEQVPHDFEMVIHLTAAAHDIADIVLVAVAGTAGQRVLLKHMDVVALHLAVTDQVAGGSQGRQTGADEVAFVRLRSRNTGGSGCDGAEAGNYIKRARADPGLPG